MDNYKIKYGDLNMCIILLNSVRLNEYYHYVLLYIILLIPDLYQMRHLSFFLVEIMWTLFTTKEYSIM